MFDSSEIREAVTWLVKSRPPGEAGGFVIFQGSHSLDYVQFALEARGLMLNWPTGQPGGTERLNPVQEVLRQAGYVEHTPRPTETIRESILNLPERRMLIAEDDLYAQSGRNIEHIVEIAVLLLTNVFNADHLPKDKVTLELY